MSGVVFQDQARGGVDLSGFMDEAAYNDLIG